MKLYDSPDSLKNATRVWGVWEESVPLLFALFSVYSLPDSQLPKLVQVVVKIEFKANRVIQSIIVNLQLEPIKLIHFPIQLMFNDWQQSNKPTLQIKSY